MSAEENKDVVRGWFEGLNRHDVVAMADLVADDFVNHSSTNQGRAGAIAEIEYWISAFPDVAATIEDLIAEGDRVVARFTTTGSHLGDFMGTPPSGRAVSFQEIDVFKLENGMITELWAAPDVYGMLTQLGMLPDDEVEA
jgi:hypothetical protein